MKVLRALVLAAAGLAVLAAPLGEARASVSVLEVGWWTNSPIADAPDGGFVVGAAVGGDSSVAAIRLDLGRGVTAAELVLSEVGGLGQDVATLRACPGPDDWTPAAGGELDQAPAADCAESVPVEAGDGDQWRADLTPLLVGREAAATVMVVPAPGADLTGTLGLGYEVRFAPPQVDATETPSANPEPPPTIPPPVTTDAAPSVPQTTVAPTPAAPGVPAAPTTTTVPGPTTTAPPSEIAAPGPAPPVLTSAGDTKPWGRLALFVPLSAALGAATTFGRRRLQGSA